MNYIVLSDVHLGADLVQHVRPWTMARLRRAAKIDRELGSMLDHYRSERDPERPWCLVIAGDLVDFIGMSIAPKQDDKLERELNEEERAHGLGSSRDHAAIKMRAVAARHRGVFEKLSRFVEAGNRLVLVRGNHDVEFYWQTARDAFVDELVTHSPGLADDAPRRAEFAARVEFAPWFYYVEGLLFVEHGHQYDPSCAYLSPLVPVDPSDPSRIGWSMADVLMRYVVQPTRGLRSEGHENLNVLDYIRMALALGVGGAWRLFWRYAHAITNMIRASSAYVGERARALRQEHDRIAHDIASRSSLAIERLRALAALHESPTAARAFDICRALLVDRVALFVAVTILLGIDALLPLPSTTRLGVALGVLLVATLLYAWSRRSRNLDPSHVMRARAAKIARLFPARYIVMGHTHEPVHAIVGPDTTYVNVGAWAVEELENEPAVPREAPRTHLVIRFVEGAFVTRFLRWDPDSGPSPVWEHRL